MSQHFIPLESAKIIWLEGLPYSVVFDDIYFSKPDGLEETRYVFIEGNQLIARWQSLSSQDSSSFVIAETGFGSGLNFLLTWHLWKQYAPKTAKLFYYACELYPFTVEDLARCVQLWPSLQAEAALLLANYPVMTPGFHVIKLDDHVQLTLMLGDAQTTFTELILCGDPALESMLRSCAIDAWFLDGFAPAKNPAMWQSKLMAAIALLSKPGTTLATFSTAKVVKAGLAAHGFQIQKRPGYGKKREMLVARFETLPDPRQLRKKSTPWHISMPQQVKEKKALIVGAGLAGAMTAKALASRGWQVIVLDEVTAGAGASGNPQAVIYPQLSAFHSPLNAYMQTAFLYAIGFYRKLLKKVAVGELTGILELAHSIRVIETQAHLRSWLAHYPELACHVDARTASEIAGVPLSQGGLFIPSAGWINPSLLCQELLTDPNIQLFAEQRVDELNFHDTHWQILEWEAEIVILANGYQATQFKQTSALTLKPILGQVTLIPTTVQSSTLRVPICGAGHVLPPRSNSHAVGATFHSGVNTIHCTDADDATNLAKLKRLVPTVEWSNQPHRHWAGIRAAAFDYLPLVGPVPHEERFLSQYQGLQHDKNRWISAAAPCYPGLFIIAGFGSRGLTTIPLCAEWLAATIHQEPSCLPQSMVKAMSPARLLRHFLIKKR